MPVDETGWWEVERATMIRQQVCKLTQPGSLIADVGCGRGRIMSGPILVDRMVVNVDSYRWPEWHPHDRVHFVVADADALPFRDGAFDLVGSFDVLEHLADDRSAVREQTRITRPGAYLVAAVPADQRLWSSHDEAVGHHRRYSRSNLRQVLEREDLTVERTTAFFSFLWLPARLVRSSHRRTRPPGNGTGPAARLMRTAIRIIAAIERSILKRWDLPVGTSIWGEGRNATPDAISSGQTAPSQSPSISDELSATVH
jgi:SAM-dependent methyltransferase